jgi:signal transduction histidine kinase
MEVWERLLDDLRAELVLREKELDLLHQIDLRLLASDQHSEDIFDFIVRETKELLEAGHTTILLRRSTYLEMMYSNEASVVGQRVLTAESLTGLSLKSDTTVNVSDLATDPRRQIYAPLRGYEGPEMYSLLATPIKINDTIVGVLNVESPRLNAFHGVHERMARAIASQISIALQRTQTLATNVLFTDVDRLIQANGDHQDFLEHSGYGIQLALEKVMAELQRLEHVQHSEAQIMVVRQDELEIIHSTNRSDIGRTLLIDKSICGRAFRECRTIVVRDVDKDPEYQRMQGDTIRSIRSEIAVPIRYSDDSDLVTGVLNVESREQDAFSEFYQLVLESFADKLRTLLTFAKLRTDVIEALEMRTADNLLVAVGDQTTHLIHRLNNVVGAMRLRIMELQEEQDSGRLDAASIRDGLNSLLGLAERTLKMPEEITRQLGQEGTTVDVNTCVRDAVTQITERDELDVALNLADEVPSLPLYCFDIVVQNLLQNAVDAMPEGGRLSISTSAMVHPTLPTGYVLMSIRDTGEGISSEVQQKMFDLNFTTKGSKGKGLGLGLWWVRNFVRRAKGDITVRSQLGSGTEVIVKIPFSNNISAE